MADDFLQKIAELQKTLDGQLKNYPFPQQPEYLYAPLRYVLAGSAKRLRPVLLTLTGQAFGVDEDDLQHAAMAVELLHNFTLVHDDIMDDDLLRHGQPTVQKKWDNATAILAGDGLVVEAQRAITRVRNNAQRVCTVFNDGALAVCVGQAYDKEYEENQTITLNDYLHMTEKKTGAMLSLCMEIPALLANQDEVVCSQLRKFGFDIGKGFQIQDDVLEIFSDADAMGKSLGSDVIAEKQTALTLMARKMAPEQWSELWQRSGEQPIDEKLAAMRTFFADTGVYAETIAMAEEYFNNAVDDLAVIPDPGREELVAFINFIKNRNY